MGIGPGHIPWPLFPYFRTGGCTALQINVILFAAMSYTAIDKIIVALKMDSHINDTIKV